MQKILQRAVFGVDRAVITVGIGAAQAPLFIQLADGVNGHKPDNIHPQRGDPIQIRNLLQGSSLTTFLSDMVRTFVNFAPLGVVLVAMLGLGVAEHTGFINAALRATLSVTPKKLLTPMLIAVGVFSHVAVDAGYVLVIPLGAVIFYAAGRHPLAGIAFQRQLERAAFDLGGGGYRAPAQRVEDFLLGRPSTGPGRVLPTYRPGVTFTDLRQCLPEFIWQTMAGALPLLERKVRGYADGDAILTAVETRSSSPVRLPRDDSGQANIRGVYPCGEGAGYAGGILSAAADGMRCAEHILEVYR